MVTTNGQPGQDDTKPETKRLLTAADYFLQSRNFADCCKYAARALDSDPTNLAATQFLSVASVLSVSTISSTHRDYYAVLNLPYFDNDAARIGSSFKALSSILDPKFNACPFSWEASDLVLKAWSVLSDPLEKERFDSELRMKLTGGAASVNGGGTFWTMCPYCYYVYEYDKVFEDCCLRCANERCRRVLHAVAIGAPPPPDVVEKGQYLCPGFMPFAICNSNGERIGEKLWMPFSPATASEGKGDDHNLPSEVDYVVRSDDETVEGEEFQNHGNGGENFETVCENATEKSANEVRMNRRKSVPWNSKKVMGRGIKIDKNKAQFIYKGAEEGQSNADENEEHVPWNSKKVMVRGIRINKNEAQFIYGGAEEGQSNADEDEEHGQLNADENEEHWQSNADENDGEYLDDETLTNVESVVEFFEGDDDVFVGLPSDFHLQNGVL